MKNQGSYRSIYIRINSENEGASLEAQTVKNPAAIRETQVWFLGGKDPLEKWMETHSNNLDWRISWTHGPWSRKESDMTEWVTLSLRKWDFSPASWQKGRGSMCTLEAGKTCCSGRIYTGPEGKGCGNVRTQEWRGRIGKSFLLLCLFWFSLFFKSFSWSELRDPSWVWKEHHQQTWMLAGPGHKPPYPLPHGSSSASFGLLSSTLSKSLDPASMGGFGSSALTESRFWALLWWPHSPCLERTWGWTMVWASSYPGQEGSNLC